MEILTPLRASKLIPTTLRLFRKVRRYVPHLNLYDAESKEMWSQFGPPLCDSPAQTSKASSKLKTGSLSQGNAVTSKARIIIRVSYEDHYLGDVAILNLGKTSSRVQSSSQLDLEKCCIPHQTEAFLQLSAKFI